MQQAADGQLLTFASVSAGVLVNLKSAPPARWRAAAGI